MNIREYRYVGCRTNLWYKNLVKLPTTRIDQQIDLPEIAGQGYLDVFQIAQRKSNWTQDTLAVSLIDAVDRGYVDIYQYIRQIAPQMECSVGQIFEQDHLDLFRVYLSYHPTFVPPENLIIRSYILRFLIQKYPQIKLYPEARSSNIIASRFLLRQKPQLLPFILDLAIQRNAIENLKYLLRRPETKEVLQEKGDLYIKRILQTLYPSADTCRVLAMLLQAGVRVQAGSYLHLLIEPHPENNLELIRTILSFQTVPYPEYPISHPKVKQLVLNQYPPVIQKLLIRRMRIVSENPLNYCQIEQSNLTLDQIRELGPDQAKEWIQTQGDWLTQQCIDI